MLAYTNFVGEILDDTNSIVKTFFEKNSPAAAHAPRTARNWQQFMLAVSKNMC